VIENPGPVESADLLTALSPELNLLLARMRAVSLGDTAVAMSFDPRRGAEK
jgi:hypothetical protein